MKHMVRRDFLLGIAGSALALACPSILTAAPRVEADPQKLYTIGPDAGPWVIMCACFTGDDAQDLGRQTALWLRAKQNFAGFTFDKSQQLRDQQEQEIADRKRRDPLARAHRIRVEEQCAVLIGGFKDQDAASEALRKTVKHLPPPQIQAKPNVLPFDVLTFKDKDGYKQVPINPFTTAMVVPNPTIPLDKPTKKEDAFLKDLNKDEPMSLLKNPAPWTMLVREFGDSAFMPENMKSGGFLDKLPFMPQHEDPRMHTLERAALLAQIAADWLKRYGYEAYVLHTRESSYVTIGGFDRADDPRMEKMYNKLATDSNFKQLQMLYPMYALEVPRP